MNKLKLKIARFFEPVMKTTVWVTIAAIAFGVFMLTTREISFSFSFKPPVHYVAQSTQPVKTMKPELIEVANAIPVQENEAVPITEPNLQAPVDAEFLLKIKDEKTVNYIVRFAGVARGESRKYGIPASIKMGQGLIESRAGTSGLAVNNNNHFGMKCHSKICKKGHCTNATDDSHKDFFRKYETAWESWRAHSVLISNGRYASLTKHGTKDYKAWAHGLKKAGYATDKRYAEKLIDVIEKYSLHKLDQ